MRRLPSLVGVLACLVASSALAQNFEFGPASQPANPYMQPPGPERSPYLPSDKTTTDIAVELEEVVKASTPDSLVGFLGYRYGAGSTDWIVGNGEQFGMVSLRSNHYLGPGVDHGFDLGINLHFLSGPITTDMPARVYDFSVAYQHRDQLGPFSYDVAASVMASSDFEGNSREGIRFPGHAVGYLSISPTTELVLGADYLDRGDVKLLPVGGLILVPHRDMRFELVFPRPRVVFQLPDKYQLYVGGELGGGTWAIERATTMVDDLATYRDLRLCIGLQYEEEDGDHSAIEIGYLFDRQLEYTSGMGNFRPNDTAMIRLVRTY